MLKSVIVQRRSKRIELVIVLALAAGLVACGSDGEPSGQGGSAGAGGSGMPVVVNGCDSTMAIDKTKDTITTVTFAGIEYTPRCVRIHAGSTVVFTGNFASHPLVGGTVAGATATPDPGSPVPPTDVGTEITFTLAKSGAHPYYCSAHASSGMMGAIFVE
jgi:plastocyanin